MLCCLFKQLYLNSIQSAQTRLWHGFLFPKLFLCEDIQLKHVKLQKCDWQLSSCIFFRNSVSGCQRDITCKPRKLQRGTTCTSERIPWGLENNFLLHFLWVLLSIGQPRFGKIEKTAFDFFSRRPTGTFLLEIIPSCISEPSPTYNTFGCGTVHFCWWCFPLEAQMSQQAELPRSITTSYERPGQFGNTLVIPKGP